MLVKSSALQEAIVEINQADSAAEILLQPSRVRSNIETSFNALMLNQDFIDQLRVLDMNTGKELVRVQRSGEQLITTPSDELQFKGQRDYFLNTKKLEQGNLYVSSIDLNKENGQVELPIKPTIRLGTLLWDAQGNAQTMLVMNINASSLLASVTKTVNQNYDLYLLNAEEQFIIHPDPELSFAHELGSDITWRTEFAEQLSTQDKLIEARSVSGKTKLLQYEQVDITFNNQVMSRSLALAIVVSDKYYVSEVQSRRITTYLLAFGVCFVVFVLILFFNSFLQRKVALIRARTEYSAIINSTSDAIISLDTDGSVVTWNLAAQRIFSLSVEQVRSKIFDELALIPDLAIQPYIDKIVSGEQIRKFDIEFESKYGQQLTLEFTLTPIIADKLIGLALVIRDISLQRESEKAIMASNKVLEEQVQERTIELEAARNEALKASQIKSDFISNISHEMRTPLNGIAGAIELLRQENLNSSQEAYLRMAVISIDNLNGWVNDVLDISKIEAGKLEFEQKRFDLVEQIEDVAATFSIRAESKHLDFALDISGVSHRFAIGDKNRLRQVINNLLSNAFKFTRTGHVALQAKTSCVGKDITFECMILDTGVGIAKANQDKLFNVFTQESSAVAGEFGGTGLGLSISKKLVEMMGGVIRFDSEKNKGSQFTFTACFQNVAAQPELEKALSGLSYDVELSSAVVNHSVCAQLDALGAQQAQGHPDILITDQTLLESLLDRDATLVFALQQPSLYTPVDTVDKVFCSLIPFKTSDLLLAVKQVFTVSPALEAFFALVAEHEESTAVQDISLLSEANILVVDDNDINIEVVKGMFNGFVKSVFSAKDGLQALSLLEKSSKGSVHVDLVLMDCSMPIMDGFECTRAIRDGQASSTYKDIPIIAVTAGALSGEREKCLAAGMNDFLTKPISRDRLLAHCIKWLNVE